MAQRYIRERGTWRPQLELNVRALLYTDSFSNGGIQANASARLNIVLSRFITRQRKLLSSEKTPLSLGLNALQRAC